MCNYHCPKQERWIPTESIFPIFKMHLFNTKCRLCSGVSRFLRLFEWGETIGRMEPRLDGIRERRMPEFHSALSHTGLALNTRSYGLTGCPKNKLLTEFCGQCWKTRFADYFEPYSLPWTVWLNLGHSELLWATLAQKSGCPILPSKFSQLFL